MAATVECIADKIGTLLLLELLAIMSFILCSIPLYMMCCCSEPPRMAADRQVPTSPLIFILLHVTPACQFPACLLHTYCGGQVAASPTIWISLHGTSAWDHGAMHGLAECTGKGARAVPPYACTPCTCSMAVAVMSRAYAAMQYSKVHMCHVK